MTTTIEDLVAGDTATLRLHITPEGDVPVDASTTATVELLDPSGTTRAPTAFPGDTRADWSATVDELLAGEYVGRWTVTGTGAGVESVRILVAPAPGDDTSRTYATSSDLAAWLRAAPPAGSRGLLVKASRRIDELIVAAVYDVDDAGLPTDAGLAAVLRDATCAQAAYQDAAGEDDTGDRYSQVSIGSVRLAGRMPGGMGGSSGSRYADEAVRILARAGFMSGRPWVCP